jgi:hypothetical protein
LGTTSSLASTCRAAASAFKSKHLYPRASVVHIAVPFAREGLQAPAIFVTARVVPMPPIAGSELFRCGIVLLPLRYCGHICLVPDNWP